MLPLFLAFCWISGWRTRPGCPTRWYSWGAASPAWKPCCGSDCPPHPGANGWPDAFWHSCCRRERCSSRAVSAGWRTGSIPWPDWRCRPSGAGRLWPSKDWRWRAATCTAIWPPGTCPVPARRYPASWGGTPRRSPRRGSPRRQWKRWQKIFPTVWRHPYSICSWAVRRWPFAIRPSTRWTAWWGIKMKNTCTSVARRPDWTMRPTICLPGWRRCSGSARRF